VLNFTTDHLVWDIQGFKVLKLLLFSSRMLMASIPENLSLLMEESSMPSEDDPRYQFSETASLRKMVKKGTGIELG